MFWSQHTSNNPRWLELRLGGKKINEFPGTRPTKVRKGGEQTNSDLVTTIAPRGIECSNEFLHTSTIIEKENHTRGGGAAIKSKGAA